MLDLENAKLERHSITISGHRTSLSLERQFWTELKRLANRDDLSIAELVRRLDEARTGSLSGAIRSYVLQETLAERDLHQGADGAPDSLDAPSC